MIQSPVRLACPPPTPGGGPWDSPRLSLDHQASVDGPRGLSPTSMGWTCNTRADSAGSGVAFESGTRPGRPLILLQFLNIKVYLEGDSEWAAQVTCSSDTGRRTKGPEAQI